MHAAIRLISARRLSHMKPVAKASNDDVQPKWFKSSEPAADFSKTKGEYRLVIRVRRDTELRTIMVRASSCGTREDVKAASCR